MTSSFDRNLLWASPLGTGEPPKPVLSGLVYLLLPNRDGWGRFRLDIAFHPKTFGSDGFHSPNYPLGLDESMPSYSGVFDLDDESESPLFLGTKTAPGSGVEMLMGADFVMNGVGLSTLYTGTSKTTGRIYAVKMIENRSLIRDAGSKSLASLPFRHTIADSPFFTTLFFVFESDSVVYLAVNYLGSGTLFEHLRDKYGSWTPHSIVLLYTAEMTLALQSLSQHGVCWDLEPKNVLVDSNRHLTLSDFGVTKDKGQTVTEYSAPEILVASLDHKSFVLTHSSYLWWLGCFIFHVSVGASSFYGMDKLNMATKIAKGELGPGSGGMGRGHQIQGLIDSLLVTDPRARLGVKGGFEEVKSHGYFGKFTNEIWAAVGEKGIPPRVFQGLRLVSL
ncbi:kinase-like domain-containing protein [Lasiosphaeris hirsuta]|uniref:non-specific serine/threonine protein kinase n=1 Tax=Lasiosphaeris hirsuta TaxID=260670 RepID=A0AA40BBJ9_9PEZI|nr:kinase-like domain-containing protein [Lasiosphaeris hirsuta]